MPTLHERVETSLPIEQTFAFIGDFANSMVWDPGTVASERIGDGPLEVGARYRLAVRMGPRTAPMEYRIVELDVPRRVVLFGSGSGVEARDDIRFEATPSGGTIVDYKADLKLVGFLRLLQPFAGKAFSEIGRKAAAGMREALAELESEHAGQRAQTDR
ncbi:MAG TPA: SRPBCC family protein [Candidatus Limnocylindria bacterium]|nr:SRPBCC family protein [Candidatus Limnocylindria bacterium]